MDESESDSDSDRDNDSGSEDDQSVTEEEQLLIDATAVEKRDQQLTLLLERKNELPLRTRNKFDELVAVLLTKTKDDIHEMICEKNIHDDDYRGLDSSRDTEAEVETAIRIFPEVISQLFRGGYYPEYPIQRLCVSNTNDFNVKAASFIALLARVAIEFHSFEDHERGGLLIEDYNEHNTFENLIYHFRTCPDQNDMLLPLLIRLRRMGLFKKDDIRDYNLVSSMVDADDFPETGFQFLVEWDPTSLIRTDRHGSLPLHYAAARTSFQSSSIRRFQIMFGYGIRYYPVKKGIRLLFQKDNNGGTPFQYVCRKYGRDKVMEIVEEILTRYHSEGTPLNIVDVLMVAAADENVHLDCSYFLLRREPNVLVRLLSGPQNNNGDGDGNHNDVDNDEDHDEDEDNNNRDGVGSDGDGGDDDNDDGGDEGGAGTRKRKRRV